MKDSAGKTQSKDVEKDVFMVPHRDDSDDGDRDRKNGVENNSITGDSSVATSFLNAYNHPHKPDSHLLRPPSMNGDCKDTDGRLLFQDEGKYPKDSYSFLALYGPIQNPLYFYFGLMAFLFQFSFLTLMILSVFSEFGEGVDNPGTGLASGVFPSNASTLVRVTQITSMLSFMVFADSTVLDLARAVEMTPPIFCFLWMRPKKRGDKNWNRDSRIFFACCLRFVQGLMAVFAVFLLVMTSSSVIDIILNFTAVNFISALDDTAFYLARWGKFGPHLKREATNIERKDLPEHTLSKRVHIWYSAAIVPTAVLVLVSIGSIVMYQESSDKWITKTFRVQFQEETGLESYSGCYHIDPNQRINKRYIYQSDSHNANRSKFGYCLTKRRWLFFRDDINFGDGDDIDPCQAEEDELAHSSRTSSFDVSTSFLEDWFSFFNTPLEMYFVQEKNLTVLEENCGSFVNDGVCDSAFNNFFYQYDGGDCCASTCSGPKCGIVHPTEVGTAASREGVQNEQSISVRSVSSGSGSNREIRFPECSDPEMVTFDIKLGSVMEKNESDKTWWAKMVSSLDGWEEHWMAYLELVCSGKTMLATTIQKSMAGIDLQAKIDPDSLSSNNCTITTKNMNLLWTVEIDDRGGGNEQIVKRQTSNQIPKKISELTRKTGKGLIDLSDNFFTGTIPSEIGLNVDATILRLDNNRLRGEIPTELVNLKSLEELSISSNSLTGTFPWELCFLLKDLTTLNFDNNLFTGTLPTEIALLTSLTSMSLSNNSFYGLLPIELRFLTNLRSLRLGQNHFVGSLPSEIFESLTNLVTLDLGHNTFTGTIPEEIQSLTRLKHFSVASNSLTSIFAIGLSSLTSLTHLNLGQNLFSSPLPTAIANLTNLNHIDLGGNMFFGDEFLETIFSSLQKLTHLDLFGNNLVGDGNLPNGALMGLLTDLEYLDLEKIGLRGTIPIEIGTMTGLTHLGLDGNFLSGSIPSEIGLLENLKYLDVEGNDLSGPLPTEIGSLSKLTMLDVGRNSFSGTIPTEFGGLELLTEAWMYYNQFKGTIPCEFESLINLSAINLNFNFLTGVIPNGLFSVAAYVHVATQRESQLLVSEESYCDVYIDTVDNNQDESSPTSESLNEGTGRGQR